MKKQLNVNPLFSYLIIRRIVLLLVILILNLPACYGKYPIVRNYSRTLYKGGKQNWSITQNSDHKMYFANNNGLLEFDSNVWQIYPIANHTNIRSLMYDEEDGKLYAGAFNEFGYYFYDKITMKLSYQSLIPEIEANHRNFNEIWNISKDENNIYFQSVNRIFKYTDEQMKVFSFDYNIDRSASVYNTFILTSAQEGAFSLNGDILLKLPGAEILKEKKVVAILPFENSKILFVTAFHGVYLFDHEKIVKYKMDITPFLEKNQVFSAAIKDDKIAFGTVLNGLVIKNLKDNSNTYVNTLSGLQNNTILSIKFDKDGNLWLGLDKGIDYVLINTPIHNLLNSNHLYGSGYTSLVKDNTLYMGTNQGLYRTTYPLINNIHPTALELIETMQGQVWSLKEIDHTIFCGNDQGAYILENNKVKKIPFVNGTWNFKQLRKNPDYILASDYDGFYLLKKENNKWSFSHFLKGFSESGGMYEEDDQGDIWFCHWMKGIYRLSLNERLDSVATIRLYDYTKGLPVNENNIINRFQGEMIFSSMYGFYTYSEADDRMMPCEEVNTIFGILPTSVHLHESPQKDVWAVSPSLLCKATYQDKGKYELDSITYTSLIDKIILGFEHFNFIDEENILISTEDGFSHINPLFSIENVENPNVFIRSVFLINQADSLLYSENELLKNEKQVYELPYKLNSLRFEYVLPEYQSESAIYYSYILENHDKKWNNYTSENFKEYTNLNHGSYCFKIRAYNKLNGHISETSFCFKVLPPWYLSTIAVIIYCLLIIFFLYSIGYFFHKRSQKVVLEIKKEKEQQLKEQKKIFLADTEEKEKEIIELKNQQLKHDLMHKSQDLADSTMNLIRKNEILLEISSDIEKLSETMRKREDTLDYYRRLQLINKNIKENIEHDNDWKKFEQNFDIVYHNYLERLSIEYPQLNTNDKKLCAYLKMNLSSKDIAPLLNISVRSVETTRYRLRKKMGLSREVNLSEFLQKF